MSRRNGDRSRFNRLRKAKLRDRERIRAFRKALEKPKLKERKGTGKKVE